MFRRRIGPDPHKDGGGSSGTSGCPDIWELENGEFAIIGIDKTDGLKGILPSEASCGPDEKIVVIDRHILIGAKSKLPEV